MRAGLIMISKFIKQYLHRMMVFSIKQNPGI